jgi:uncharacterized protein YaaN involved in tellurite resistance
MINESELKVIESSLLQGKPPAPYQQADPPERKEIDVLIQQIDLNDTHSLLYFGAPAQQQLARISDDMLEGVRNKDTGPAGEALNRMVGTVRDFDLDNLDPNRKPGFFSRLLGKTKPVAQFLQRYEEVRNQIDAIGDELERHKTQLLKDIASLDRLYAANLEYFHHLERYIIAGEEKLKQLDDQEIPLMESKVEEGKSMTTAQQLRDLRANRDALERRVHDLKLTRQVAMQSLPSILPLWRQQLAQAVTIHRSREAAEIIRSASDLTNELLKANAENLKQGNAEARREIERGVFDIEAVKQANASLIETIEESLRIADEGRKKRTEAALQLETLEAELRRTLINAGDRVRNKLEQ